MTQIEGKSTAPANIQDLLGYLNFSSGTPDVKFLRGLDDLYSQFENIQPPGAEAFSRLHSALADQLSQLAEKSAAFRDSQQAQAVLSIVFEHLLPAYREHHSDLLFHQVDRQIFRPFFLGRACEAVLAEGPPWEEHERIVEGALGRLNDFVGHRPVAVLENGRRAEPYAHERIRPVPLYIAGAGVACGDYHSLVAGALETLATTDPEILRVASFDRNNLEELAFDPRAYDFNHPVNKRPNYHFGQWDPHRVDNQGRYRRFVLQQSLLDALLERVSAPSDLPAAELLAEASVVLAGTILMAAGTSGEGPESFDSSTTLSTLLPRIAQYRDEFYRQELAKMTGPHAERLRSEAESMRQPFAAARQHLNSQLARRRALQLQHVQLAILFARMGYPEAAVRQANVVPTASARMICRIHCLLTAAEHEAERSQLGRGLSHLAEAEQLLLRGIECGAIVDPWTILGFGGQFSLFPAVENSVPDLRVDDLLDLMEHIFALYSRLWHQAVVLADQEHCGERGGLSPPMQERIAAQFRARAEWWDRFATTTIASVKHVAGREIYDAAARVADALAAWHKAGSAAADLAFWRPHVERFDSPHTYARVVEALLERGRLAESQAVLMHWLSQAGTIQLDEGRSSFHRLVMQWMYRALGVAENAPIAALPVNESIAEKRRLLQRFFDHLEANADSLWQVPELETARELIGDAGEALPANDGDEEDDDTDTFSAAYEDVIYRDSTADGIDAEMLEAGSDPTDYELEGESSRLASRLALVTTIARLWKTVAIAAGHWRTTAESAGGKRCSKTDESAEGLLTCDSVAGWLKQAAINRQRLAQLIQTIERQPLSASSASPEALMEYDRRRVIKETLLEKVIATSVATIEAQQLLEAIVDLHEGSSSEGVRDNSEEWREIVHMWRAVLAGHAAAVRDRWPAFLAALRERPLLYVPLTKGGDGRKIAAARNLQHTFRELLRRLPRLGLLRETCQLIQAARAMERDHPLGAGAVTEFDRLFEVGYKAIVESLVESSVAWTSSFDTAGESADAQLIDALQQVTEALLSQWLSHSRTLRLSVLEKVSSEKDWHELLEFVEKYGHDLFTQRFFNLANLRAILHQGVEPWLDRLADDPDGADELSLVADLDDSLPRAQAKKHLALVIEAVVENFAEYRDYNATTTQSDRGELVYMLLDFLRVKVAYDRIHWNLRPVMMAHEVLVRCGRAGAAELWRQAMSERTGDTAEQHLRRLTQLQKKYGMRLPTVADRLAERFVRPLAIDRVKALVKPAVEQAHAGAEPAAFLQLEAEAGELADEPTGAGLDLPDWLLALEEEVERSTSPQRRSDLPGDLLDRLPRVRLSWHEFQEQLANWEVKYLEDKAS